MVTSELEKHTRYNVTYNGEHDLPYGHVLDPQQANKQQEVWIVKCVADSLKLDNECVELSRVD